MSVFLHVALWDELVGVKANKDSQTVFVKLYQTLRYVFLNLFVAAKQLDKKKKNRSEKMQLLYFYLSSRQRRPTDIKTRAVPVDVSRHLFV